MPRWPRPASCGARCDEITGLDIGIGVSAGLAVAGNIGAANRFEYTVIGDPVNEASRLTELAKAHPGRVLASSSALYFADESEQEHWITGDEVQLRGRRRKTRLAWPKSAIAAPRMDEEEQIRSLG